jgi:L-arginine dehydrogenase
LPEQPIVLDEQDLKAFLPKLDIQTILAEAFASLHQGRAVQPPQTLSLFPKARGDFIAYLGILEPFDVFGVKLSPYIVTDSAPTITAWTLLMSMKTGRPLLLCDSSLLTRERTAATTALAVDKLSSPQASVLSLIGSGNLAQAHLRQVSHLRPWKEVRVFSPNLSQNPERLASLQKAFPLAAIADSPKQAAKNADVIMLVTSSGKPVIDFKDIPSKALVTSISTNAPKAYEIDPASLPKMSVYCDYRETTPQSAGEMVLATEGGYWSKEDLLGDLPGLCAKADPVPPHGKPIFFRSIGLGLEDVAIAYALYGLVKAKS